MFNNALLNSEVQNFISDFEGNISKLAFSGSPFENITTQEIIQQIESRQKTKKKLPKWFKTPNIIYPPKLNMEQTSSEITAQYKAKIISGNTLADITGGFGIDTSFLAKKFKSVHHYEVNPELSKIAEHNFKVLGLHNIECFNADGIEAILERKYDAIYADPSRRHESKGKVFFLRDCQPNISENLSALMQRCGTFLLKTSPMLDLSIGMNELGTVAEIHIIAVENEVKELLWLINKDASHNPTIKTINFLKSGTEKFDFEWGEKASAQYQLPQKYLYEPNSAILKSGAFDLVSEKLHISKLHKHTHLYTNDTLIDFPGRRFLIEKRVPYNKSEIRSALNFQKANITIRNFPETVEVLRKKWKLAEGGNIYLFFVTNSEDKKEMIICTKA